jgi:serine/threonine protein kinase/Tol biopolymer transport system component
MADGARLDVPADDERTNAGMTDDVHRWERVKDVFQSALERAPGNRSGFVAAACHGDDALQREVESLLAAHDDAGTFAERTPMEPMMAGLRAGMRFGPYSIVERIGVGGMGEVYRARDTRLGRDVALKVLSPEFAANPDRLARLEREARVLASLNHPHIATIHGLEEHNDARALVLELVAGTTVADRLASGPLRVNEAIAIAKQIAEALEAAHEKGIVHRDLKPANIMLTPAGVVKVLDFGLAKSTQDSTTGGESVEPTREGLVVGTVAYMSPEQARGQSVDARTDIWAFGCVFYEMLTGRSPFVGATVTDTLAAIVEREPDWTAFPQSTPPAIRRLLQRCLHKEGRNRLHSVADARLEIEEALSIPKDAVAPTPVVAAKRTATARAFVPLGIVAIGILLIATPYLRRDEPPREATRFLVTPPEGWALSAQSSGGPATNPLAVSPDGRHLAFALQNASGASRIWIRSLDTLDARELDGTDGGAAPFWSPDSRWLAFVARGKLHKIDVAGGAAVPLCDCPSVRAGTWNRDGVLLFFDGSPLLRRVSASAGIPTNITTLGKGETYNTRPHFLPDGRHFLYRSLLATAISNRGPIYVGSLESNERTHVLDADSTNVVYSQHHLLFLRDNALIAQPFDAERLTVAGEAFPVAEQIRTFGGLPFGFFSASENGVLAYQTGTSARGPQLTWIDRSGNVLGRVGARALYNRIELSPDGTMAAVQLQTNGQEDVWVLDLERDGNPRRLTFDTLPEGVPIWSPESDRVVYAWSRSRQSLHVKSTHGADGGEELLPIEGGYPRPASWSRDGQHLLYEAQSTDGREEIWVLPLSGDRKPSRFASHPVARQFNSQFSPDGRWIAYVSNESGRFEVYVAPFMTPGAKGMKISSNGGRWPRWSQDGKELFYVDGLPNQPKTLVAATISQRGLDFRVDTVTRLFVVRWPEQAPYFYAPARDGKRFLVNVEPDIESDPPPITVVVNWLAAFKK